MGRKRSAVPRKSVWDDDYRPYGVNEGARGNASQWKKYFDQAMGLEEANAIVKEESPWTILGLKLGAGLAEIKKAFRTLVFKVHPDHGGTEEAFRRVHAAYTILKDGK